MNAHTHTVMEAEKQILRVRMKLGKPLSDSTTLTTTTARNNLSSAFKKLLPSTNSTTTNSDAISSAPPPPPPQPNLAPTPARLLKSSSPHENPIKYDVYGRGSKKSFCEIGDETEVPYCINQNHTSGRYIVRIEKYNLSLRDWLSKNERTFSKLYQTWGVYRPSKRSLQLIRALLREVCFWHAHGRCCGNLLDIDSILIFNEAVDPYNREAVRNIERVVFVMDPNNWIGGKSGIKNDMKELFDLIFKVILRTQDFRSFSDDLFHFYEVIKNSEGTQDDWKILFNHPSLWQWKDRFNFFIQFDGVYKSAGSTLERTLDLYFKNFNGYNNWSSLIPKDGPLAKMFKHSLYVSSPRGFIKFIRVIHTHFHGTYVSRKRNIRKPYVAQHNSDYRNAKFIELKTSQTYSCLLVSMYLIAAQLKLSV